MKNPAMRFASIMLAALLSAPFAAADVSDEAFAGVVQRLQLLEDREAIRHLLETYIDFNEARDYRGYSQLFATNGKLNLRRGAAVGPDAIYELLEENFGGPLPADSFLRNASHVLSNVIIEVDGDTATARSRWALLSPSPADGTPYVAQSGFYRDSLVRENGEWKFLERSIVTGIPVPEASQ
jgi:hypothetical protein